MGRLALCSTTVFPSTSCVILEVMCSGIDHIAFHQMLPWISVHHRSKYNIVNFNLSPCINSSELAFWQLTTVIFGALTIDCAEFWPLTIHAHLWTYTEKFGRLHPSLVYRIDQCGRSHDYWVYGSDTPQQLELVILHECGQGLLISNLTVLREVEVPLPRSGDGWY